MADNYELDYKAMFEAMQERVRRIMKADEEYFSLMTVINENAKYGTALSPVILKIPKADQIKYMRIAAKLAICSRELCEKHHLLDEEETEESEELQ